jgi:hypothetical protein
VRRGRSLVMLHRQSSEQLSNPRQMFVVRSKKSIATSVIGRAQPARVIEEFRAIECQRHGERVSAGEKGI